ncbi:MAG: VIT domain-containing protein [Candidatus Obscuribacter sp.]|nr:VIT domain-containing protein [Candidatus Obscuribacter sp.]
MTDHRGGQPFERTEGEGSDRKNSVLALTMTRPSNKKECEGERARSTFNAQTQGGVKKKGVVFFFFGVVLPVLSVLFETKYHFCAERYFDPFPTAGHVVLFLLIPFSNFLIWLATRRDLSQHYGFMSLASGMAMGIGILYTLMFLPLTPMSCLFSLALGFGLLGLAPLLSLPCSFASGKTITKLAHRKDTYFDAHQVEHIGHLIVLVMVVAVELPSTLTRVHLAEAINGSPVLLRRHGLNPKSAAAADWLSRSGALPYWFPDPSKADGAEVLPALPQYLSAMDWLRRYGNQEVLLRACYERSGKATDILGSLYESAHPISVEDARQIYYQVTGKPYNSVPIPASFRATIKHARAVSEADPLNSGVTDEFDRDTDIAGENVSGMARGLSMSNSLMGGDVDVDGAQARLNWSFQFRNASKYDREARMRLQLPAGAVVSKALLTVNGVTKLAQIQLKSEARAHYQKAVLQHQDPLLVSSCGLDQVLVQCFPVAPGETMQVRLFIDAPCAIDAQENCALHLPLVIERNFVESGPLRLDLTSTRPLQIAGLGPVVPMESESSGASESSTGGETAAPPPQATIEAGPQTGFAPPPVGVGTQVAACAIAMPEPLPSALPPVEIKASTRGDEVELLERTRLSGDQDLHLTGSLTALQLGNMEAIIRANRDKNVKIAWCAAPRLEGGKVVKRPLKPAVYEGVSRLYVVVDGSSVMSKYLKSVAAGLKSLPSSISSTIYLVGDQSLRLGNSGFKGDEKPYLEAVQKVEGFVAVGGQDDSLVLQEALMRAGREKDSAVLWIHGAQPLSPGSFTPIERMLVGSPLRPALFDLPVSSGPNEILNGVDADTRILRVNRSGDLADDLKNLFHSIDPSFAASREQLAAQQLQYVDSSGLTEAGARKVSPWLVNIFAAAEIKRRLSGCPAARVSDNPVLLADLCKIVSPVSSAIVVSPDSHAYVAKTEEKDLLTAAMGDFLGRIFPSMLNTFSPLPVEEPRGYYYNYPTTASTPVAPGENLINSAFNGVTRQLNSLSSAAGAPGGSYGPAVKNLTAKQSVSAAKRELAPYRSDAFGGEGDAYGGAKGNATGVSGAPIGGDARRMNEQTYGASDGPAAGEPLGDGVASDELSMAAPIAEKKAAIDAERDKLSGADLSRMKEMQASARGMRFNFQPARYRLESGPTLQGATNGSILPQFLNFGHDAGKDVGLVGAPVDPRYGQSNRIATEGYDAEASLQKTANLFTLIVVVVGLMIWFLFYRGRSKEEDV